MRPEPEITGVLHVCHMIGGEQWAGAEVQMAHLLSGLARYEELDLSAILFADGRLAQHLRQSRIAVHVVDEAGAGRIGLVRRVASALRSRPVDILHTHGYKGNVIGALTGRWAGVRSFVRTAHGRMEPWEGIDRPKMNLYAALDHLVDRYAVDRVIAVSSDLYQDLASRLPAGRVALIRNGIDPRRVEAIVQPRELRQQLGLAQENPLFGTVGRLTPVKGLEYFLQAARRILVLLPDAQFLIVGEGPLQPELQRRARELGIERAVSFLGFRPDVPDITNMLDVFVMPSLHEGLPLALLEAMVLGKPIVASAVGGIREVLHDPRGWLVPPGDVGALQDACLEALAAARNGSRAGVTPGRLQEVGNLASAMCERTRALYRELVPQTGRGS